MPEYLRLNLLNCRLKNLDRICNWAATTTEIIGSTIWTEVGTYFFWPQTSVALSSYAYPIYMSRGDRYYMHLLDILFSGILIGTQCRTVDRNWAGNIDIFWRIKKNPDFYTSLGSKNLFSFLILAPFLVIFRFLAPNYSHIFFWRSKGREYLNF